MKAYSKIKKEINMKKKFKFENFLINCNLEFEKFKIFKAKIIIIKTLNYYLSIAFLNKIGQNAQCSVLDIKLE